MKQNVLTPPQSQVALSTIAIAAHPAANLLRKHLKPNIRTVTAAAEAGYSMSAGHSVLFTEHTVIDSVCYSA